jgi:quercetin dioxygenase-like cupin family protein
MVASDKQGAPQAVFNIADLVRHQKDSVVSRTLIKKDKGTVTLFAFDKENALSEHTAPFDALAVVLDGECQIMIAGEPHAVKEGEAIILPANRPHAVKAVTAFKMLLIMIRE